MKKVFLGLVCLLGLVACGGSGGGSASSGGTAGGTAGGSAGTVNGISTASSMSAVGATQ